MSQQATFGSFDGFTVPDAETDTTQQTNTAMTNDDGLDKHRRKTYAEDLRTTLEAIDGVEEVIIDDATPQTWESVAFAVILPGEMGWASATERGVILDDSVNLRSLAQRLNHVLDEDDHVSTYEVVNRPEKISDNCHDSTLYLIDVWYP